MKYKNIILFLLVSLCLAANIYVRYFPAWLPQLKDRAYGITAQEYYDKGLAPKGVDFERQANQFYLDSKKNYQREPN